MICPRPPLRCPECNAPKSLIVGEGTAQSERYFTLKVIERCPFCLHEATLDLSYRATPSMMAREN